ncbi:E3 ubiquitin-protein ligase ZNRF2, partial [Blattella germanica]
ILNFTFFFLFVAGIKCPVCAKFVLPDDIECHLVMCLTKPRLSYNESLQIKWILLNILMEIIHISEDVLTDDKGECVICLEDLQQGDTIARLPCLCIYHKRFVFTYSIFILYRV